MNDYQSWCLIGLNYVDETVTDNMDLGQHISDISSKTKSLDFLRRNLIFIKTLIAVRVYLYLPDTPNTSRRVLRGVRAKMALIFCQNNQNITFKDVLIT